MRPSIVLFALMISLASRAAPPDAKSSDAKMHFDEGTKAFNLGEFDRAAKEYRVAYEAKPDPIFLYNIAQAYRLGNNLQQALFFYRSYLRNATDPLNRSEVEDRIRKLESQLREQQAVTTQPPNTPVSPGTAPPRTSVTEPTTRPPAPTPPPETRPAPTTTAPPSATPAATATAEPGSNAALTASAPARRESTPVYKKWWLWTAVGVVAVGVGLGVGLGLGLSSSPPSAHFGNTGVF
jgi:tetratricopeptide (TPR) repeat protein